MLYGEEKRREMARSVLPSNARKSARDGLRAIARSHRRRGRQALREMRDNLCDEADDDLVADVEDRLETRLTNSQARRKGELWSVIDRRREADKIHPLMRWAPAAVAHLDVEDRLPTLRSWLPDGVIGWHAMTHLDWVDGLRNDDLEHNRWFRSYGARPYDIERERAARVATIESILDRGLHAELNRRLKRAGLSERLLMGRHDVEAFVEHTWHRHGIRSLSGCTWITPWSVVEGMAT